MIPIKYYYQTEGDLRNNIGDILQGMVARAFLPPNSSVVNREALADMPRDEKSLLLANGWYMHSFNKFPPPNNVDPIYISVHIAQSQLLRNKHVREHFKKHAPIGCRDHKTLKLFLGWGIPAYYSGCLTVTTEKRADINHSGVGEYLLVDNVDHPVPVKIKTKLEDMLGTSLINISHNPPDINGSTEAYFLRSEQHLEVLLERYCKAALVITTKIHCALPCLGMGANVMMIHPNPSDPRLDTVRELMEIVSYDEILAAKKFLKPAVYDHILEKRKAFLRNIASKSVATGTNIVNTPDTTTLYLIKAKSIVLSKFYNVMLRTMLVSGMASIDMKRVFGHDQLVQSRS